MTQFESMQKPPPFVFRNYGHTGVVPYSPLVLIASRAAGATSQDYRIAPSVAIIYYGASLARIDQTTRPFSRPAMLTHQSLSAALAFRTFCKMVVEHKRAIHSVRKVFSSSTQYPRMKSDLEAKFDAYLFI